MHPQAPRSSPSLALLLGFALLASACTRAAAPASAPPITPPILPTAAERTVLSTATSTLSPSPTIPPPRTIAFYRLRIELSTTSDWTTLRIENPEHLLTARLISVEGNPQNASAGLDQLNLGQPIADGQAGHRIALTVDYALDPVGISEPLRFFLQKGALRGSLVRILLIDAGEPVLLQEISHSGAVESDPGLNPLAFSLDLGPLSAASPQGVEIPSVSVPRMLWAFYYPWYTLSDWSSDWLSDTPAAPYRSDDPEALARQIEEATQAGIDGFISSWWGPGDYTDHNLRLLLDLAEERDFRVTVYFETITDSGPRPSTVIEEWLAYLIQTYGDHPAFMRLDERPVIVVWASATVPLATWQEIFAHLDQQGLQAAYIAMGYDLGALDLFYGVHEYGVFSFPDLTATYAQTAAAIRAFPLLLDPPEPRLWIATVQPGYDDTRLPGREGLTQPREAGAFYRETWQAAVASNPDWIFITTWNEWWEHTYIEPSDAYGDQYLQITRELALAWKGP